MFLQKLFHQHNRIINSNFLFQLGKASYSMQNQEMTDRSNDYNALRMRGLPYTVQEQDVMDFFNAYNIGQNAIKLGRTPDGRSSGQAAILF